MKYLSQEIIIKDIDRALEEDIGAGDLSAGLISPQITAHAKIICRESAVICGKPWVSEILKKLAPEASEYWHVRDGQRCDPGELIVEIAGRADQLLTAERTCLNYLQTLSAVATNTARYVDAVKGTASKVYDTRKTIPGLRVAEKYAVRCGGGHNHRMGLYDAILIKENHIAAAGGIASAYLSAKALTGDIDFIQVEVETIGQLQEAIGIGVSMILLDNMSMPEIREAVNLAKGKCSLEVSGGVTLDNIGNIALTGVDRISVGAIIKDIKAVDFSMRFESRPVQKSV